MVVIFFRAVMNCVDYDEAGGDEGRLTKFSCSVQKQPCRMKCLAMVMEMETIIMMMGGYLYSRCTSICHEHVCGDDPGGDGGSGEGGNIIECDKDPGPTPVQAGRCKEVLYIHIIPYTRAHKFTARMNRKTYLSNIR